MNNSKPLRVLYAEDDADACYMMATILSFSNIEVVTAGTIAEAWRAGQSEDFDLYLLDSRFSDGSGLKLCRRLRAYAPRKPIVFYSGEAYETDTQNGLAAGASKCLIKPNSNAIAETIFTLTKQFAQTAEPTI